MTIWRMTMNSIISKNHRLLTSTLRNQTQSSSSSFLLPCPSRSSLHPILSTTSIRNLHSARSRDDFSARSALLHLLLPVHFLSHLLSNNISFEFRHCLDILSFERFKIRIVNPYELGHPNCSRKEGICG